MPPQLLLSDSEGEDNAVQSTKPTKKSVVQVLSDEDDDATPEEVVQDGEEEEPKAKSDDESGGEDEPAEEEYIVESIMDHKFEGKKLFYLVKWQDYPKKSDWTWEPEEHLAGGSDEILNSYFDSIGGKPTRHKSPKGSAARKRGRTSNSVAGTPVKSTKKPRTSIAAQSVASPAPTTASKDSKWTPPSGMWENEIAAIDTIEKTESGLVCYVQWNNGKKSQHDIKVVYKKCPQRMLTFYEQHLIFKSESS